jgi:hypothetical protein
MNDGNVVVTGIPFFSKIILKASDDQTVKAWDLNTILHKTLQVKKKKNKKKKSKKEYCELNPLLISRGNSQKGSELTPEEENANAESSEDEEDEEPEEKES